jgi:hypothetical protein
MIPPILLDITIRTLNKKGFRIWLPFVLFWPVLLIVYLVIIPFAAIVEIVLISQGIRPFSILIELHRALSCLRGTLIDVSSGPFNNQTKLKIRFV